MPEPAPDVFTALADPLRRALLDRLARDGAASASALARHVPVTRQAVMKHLSTLQRAGLVTTRRMGREVRFEVTPEALREAMDWMSVLAEAWERRLAAIKELAEQ